MTARVNLRYRLVDGDEPCPGALVEVRHTDARRAVIWSSADGEKVVANPMVTDEDGWIDCWVLPASYEVVMRVSP